MITDADMINGASTLPQLTRITTGYLAPQLRKDLGTGVAYMHSALPPHALLGTYAQYGNTVAMSMSRYQSRARPSA